MISAEFIFQSNLFQILLTLLSGVALYAIAYGFVTKFCANRYPGRCRRDFLEKIFISLVWLGALFVAAVILLSFLFDLGETYQYSGWYKRSFGPFGDGFPFVLILLVAFGFFLKSRTMIVLALSVIVLTGGRMVIVASIFCMIFLYVTNQVRCSRKTILLFSALPLFVYFVALTVSNHLIADDVKKDLIADDVKKDVGAYINRLTGIENKLAGQGVCRSSDKCFETQVASPFKQRLSTSVAGLWMTMKGGYPGSSYPGTPEKFADFMILHNPFGLNDRFNLDWDDWYKAKAIQNPYLNVGSGYGPLGLALALFFYFYTSIVGYKNMRSGLDRTVLRSLTVFFIFLALINQTQQWIQAGSLLLFISGIAAAHIWILEISSRSGRRAGA